MTTPLSRQRSQIAIPAQGMIEIRDALTDLLNEFGMEDQASVESGLSLLILFLLSEAPVCILSVCCVMKAINQPICPMVCKSFWVRSYLSGEA